VNDGNSFEVIVIGVGAMGSSACYHLARRGVRVLGLEQFSIPNDLGSSHGDSRLIRLCYFEHPDYVPLLRRSYELWDAIEAESRQTLLRITGGIYMGAADGAVVTGTLRSAAEHALPHERLDRGELRHRYPQFDVPEDYVGIYEPRAGMLFPELSISAAAALALRHGARLRGQERVVRWNAEGQGLAVHTDRATYRADKLVFCGGAWSATLLSDLAIPLTVTRQVLGWVWPKKPELFELEAMPVWAIDHPDGTLHYGFPLRPERPGFKIAHHGGGIATDPNTVDRTIGPEDEQSFRHILDRYLPDASGEVLSMGVCLYTNSPDRHFIIDVHPDHPQVFLACGFSGHGFKFAPVIGEVLADLVVDGTTAQPIGFLRLGRFG